MSKSLKFEAAVPQRARDNLVGSPAFRHIKRFVPSYEQSGDLNMYYIMGWEYGRMWFKEVRKFEKMMYGKENSGKKEIFQRASPTKPVKKKQ